MNESLERIGSVYGGGLVQLLRQREEKLSVEEDIPSVGFTYEKLQLTRSQYTAVSVALGMLLPAVVFVAGVVMWLRRRRL